MCYCRISAAACVFLCIFVIIVLTTTGSVTRYIHGGLESPYCPDSNSNYSDNSQYYDNLDQLLSWLSANSSSRTNGYYNATVISAGDPNVSVYGAFLCRGDLTPDACRDCVSAAQAQVFQTCPVEKSSMIWLSDCYLRFSDRPFFSVLDSGSIMIWVCNPGNASDVSSFMDLLGKTLTAAAEEAASGGPQLKFGTKEGNISSFESVYTMTQCMPGLTQLDCQQCLTTAIGELPSLCYGRQGGRVRLVSCNLRYEVNAFYKKVPPPETVSAPPPTPPPETVSAAPPTPPPEDKSGMSAGIIIAIVVPLIVFVSLLTFAAFRRTCTRPPTNKNAFLPQEIQNSSAEFQQFDFETIVAATNKFSGGNKIGEGGFGAVYKGKLQSGQDIAVKRLSRTSLQGAGEFKNEVVLVAKLQHRNLVRLLGFCLDGEEKMLIYEFVPNKSLDYFLFDPCRKQQLNWIRRYKIIEGIARGILYLHEDSRLRIIHRDLKTSNVLLDENLNPKIADFGTAILFGVDQTQGNTNRIVGTFGYMAPEYAMYGQLSVKMDVYSFGVLLIEIISGKKITSFTEIDYARDLLNYAWNHWRDGTPLELLDETLGDSCPSDEVIRCIHIGLSCVQGDPAQRPSMKTIVLMLNSHSVTLAIPEQPPSYIHSRTQPILTIHDTDNSTGQSASASVDEASITHIHAQ